MAGQAQGAFRIVHHQKIPHRVDVLHVRIVAAVALHVAVNQSHRPGCIVRGGRQRLKAGCSSAQFSGSYKLKGWMRLKLGAEILGVSTEPLIMGTCHKDVSVPTATVPSWQLRQRVLSEPSGGDALVCVHHRRAAVKRGSDCTLESFWLHSGVVLPSGWPVDAGVRSMAIQARLAEPAGNRRWPPGHIL